MVFEDDVVDFVDLVACFSQFFGRVSPFFGVAGDQALGLSNDGVAGKFFGCDVR